MNLYQFYAQLAKEVDNPVSALSKRGLKLRQWKEQSISQPSVFHRPKEEIWVPLRAQTKEKSFCAVSPGECVELGQVLSYTTRNGQPAVFAPLAGEVSDIRTLDHPYLGKELECAVLRPKPGIDVGHPPKLDVDSASSQEILSRCGNAGIIDELDGLPLAQKLAQAARDGCSILVVDALDDQPYCTSGLRTLIERRAEVGQGAVLAAAVAGASRSCIAAYRPAAVAPYLPLEAGGVSVLELTGRYPCLAELVEQMQLWGGGIRIGVQAAAALSQAVVSLTKQQSVMVTVGGPCIRTATNFRVTTGTLTSELIDQCALRREPRLIVYGGAMTGRSGELDRPVPITPQMTSILLYPTPPPQGAGRCVGCGRCSEVCPRGLVPALIARAQQNGNIRAVKGWAANRCIGCGCCSFVCPMGCDTAEAVRAAALLVQK